MKRDIVMDLPAIWPRLRVAFVAFCIGATLTATENTSVVRDDVVLRPTVTASESSPAATASEASESAPSMHGIQVAANHQPGGGV
jgi:hypothetical protein